MTTPQAAVDAAVQALNIHYWPPDTPGDLTPWEKEARAALEAAMPYIRKQIADEIRAEMPPLTSQRLGQTMRSCFEAAARIAEGEVK